MSRNKDIETMVRGMGMGMKVLELLVNEAEAQGADKSVFAFLTRPRFKTNLEKIGKAIAECDWRIPASEMRELAKKHWVEDLQNEPEMIEIAANLWWALGCNDLGIPYERYSKNPDHGDPGIPTILWSALSGQPMQHPLIIAPFANPNKREVIVDFDTKDGAIFEIGEPIDMKFVESVAVADCKYFDFEK